MKQRVRVVVVPHQERKADDVSHKLPVVNNAAYLGGDDALIPMGQGAHIRLSLVFVVLLMQWLMSLVETSCVMRVVVKKIKNKKCPSVSTRPPS